MGVVLVLVDMPHIGIRASDNSSVISGVALDGEVIALETPNVPAIGDADEHPLQSRLALEHINKITKTHLLVGAIIQGVTSDGDVVSLREIDDSAALDVLDDEDFVVLYVGHVSNLWLFRFILSLIL